MREQQLKQLCKLLQSRVLSPRDLMQSLNVSQPTLSRLISSMTDEIVVMGKGRATCYGLPRLVHNLAARLPVYSIDPRGDAHLHGHLTTLQGGQYWWEPAESHGELFNTLPWFLLDLQIIGFGGRTFAHRQSEPLRLPRHLTDWSYDDMLYAICRRGENRTGNLLIGEESLARYFDIARENPPALDYDSRTFKYPQLAQKTLAGDMSAAQFCGEQPKFTICIEEKGTPCHLLVKFSPAVDSKEARRWADLLVCEHLALEAIRTAEINVARSRLTIAGSQVFLGLKRFDRRGLLGRLPLFSLRALHAKLQCPCDNWVDAATRLRNADLLSPVDTERMRWLSLFSDLIGNQNQHFENLSLIPHKQHGYILAPAYGIRPSIYEPVACEIPSRLFTPPPVRNENAHAYPSALECAILFWKSAAIDKRISEEFRQICYENCELLKLRIGGPKLIV